MKHGSFAVMRVTRCLIDANWGNSTDVVYQFCRHPLPALRRSGIAPRRVARQARR